MLPQWPSRSLQRTLPAPKSSSRPSWQTASLKGASPTAIATRPLHQGPSRSQCVASPGQRNHTLLQSLLRIRNIATGTNDPAVDDAADAILSNWFFQRNPGTFASGQRAGLRHTQARLRHSTHVADLLRPLAGVLPRQRYRPCDFGVGRGTHCRQLRACAELRVHAAQIAGALATI